jgi:hypothetical protein
MLDLLENIGMDEHSSLILPSVGDKEKSFIALTTD